MSQDELADDSGIGRKHMSKIENDHVKPTYKMICAIAKKLDIKPSILFNKMGEIADKEMNDDKE